MNHANALLLVICDLNIRNEIAAVVVNIFCIPIFNYMKESLSLIYRIYLSVNIYMKNLMQWDRVSCILIENKHPHSLKIQYSHVSLLSLQTYNWSSWIHMTENVVIFIKWIIAAITRSIIRRHITQCVNRTGRMNIIFWTHERHSTYHHCVHVAEYILWVVWRKHVINGTCWIMKPLICVKLSKPADIIWCGTKDQLTKMALINVWKWIGRFIIMTMTY